MKHEITRFKSLSLALKELEPFIRDGEHLQTGKPFKHFGGMRSREVLANWLLCVAVNSGHPDRLTFTSQPRDLEGDGVILDTVTERTWLTEHILVPRQAGGDGADVEALILKAIEKKCTKGGTAYASGKTLVVFREAPGAQWLPNRVARRLPEDLPFDAVWVVGLQYVEAGQYVYSATRLDLSQGNAPTWRIRIAQDFGSWEVEPVQ
jgi:hypothetical protein